jgi:hypothetical protein
MKIAYVTHATENYIEVVLNLAKSLSLFSEVPLLVYFIDSNEDQVLDKTSGFSNLIPRFINLNLEKTSEKDFVFSESGNFYADRLNPRIYSILCAKTIAMEMALDEGWDKICYLDSDCLATPLVDEIFDWSEMIEDYPLATKGIHDYMIILNNDQQIGNPFEETWPVPDHKLCLEWPLMSFLEVPEDRRGTYRTTNVMLANQNCKNFIKTWKDLCYILPRIVNTDKYAPYHEETVYNVLSWKKNNKGLPLCYINLGEGIETVKHTYSDQSKAGEYRWSDYDHSKRFYAIPDDKRDIKVLHGEKRTSEVNLILDFLKLVKSS